LKEAIISWGQRLNVNGYKGGEMNFHNNASKKSFQRVFACIVASLLLSSLTAIAAPNTFQVGAGTIHDTFVNNSFDTFALSPPFAETPAVFVLGNVAGSNSCEVRMENIGTTSFDAVCAEDSSWDGEHIAVPIQYAAITEGVKTIPTNNGGSVTFEVGCVDTNRVQHNCTTGCDTESYEPISFSAGFTNPPVVIANIQTVANATLGAPPVNPISPMLSVAVDNILNTGFDLALDLNKEDNVGTLNNEKVCWLAVEETSRCDLAGTDDTLNFSSLGGPASVAFEAIITPDNIDGWDNGCNNTEEATFTPGCFTSTPVAIATKRGRQEPEGWLRYCTLNTGELRITIDEQRVTGQNRQHVDETASVIAFGASFTTPVTLSRFISQRRGNRHLDFEWETESESFNIGFHLWAEVFGEWKQLNKRMIVSGSEAVGGAQRYQKTLKLKKGILENATAFGLSSLDNSGYEEFYGPFELGIDYGESAKMQPIDWSHVRSDYNANMRKAGYELIKGRWRKLNQTRQATWHKKEHQLDREIIDLVLPQSGIYRVTYDDLRNQGKRWNQMPLHKLALTYVGKGVPRLIVSDDELFNAGDEIIFYAPEMSAEMALYTKEMRYRLQRDASKVIEASVEPVKPATQGINSGYYLAFYEVGENQQYVPTSTNGDPWVDRKVVAVGSASSTEYQVDIPYDVLDQPAAISIGLVGGIDFPSVPSNNPDHHVVISVNGDLVADVRFDGFRHQAIDVTLPAGVLHKGLNTITITLPGDTGQVADLVHIDQVILQAPHASVFNSRVLTIPGQQQIEHYQINGVANEVRLFAYQANGNFAVLEGATLDNAMLTFAALPSTRPEGTFYAVVSEQGYAEPAIINSQRLSDPLKKHTSDYLIIAHPAFINEDLKKFTDAKRQSGFAVSIVNWLDIVETYGYGMPTPHAIQNLLKQAQVKHPFTHVLIVGGHSYDYNDYLGQGNVNFIPTQYQSVKKTFAYAPTDALLVDLNDDGTPDKSIGRWPVRTTQDLTNIVNKTLQWEKASPLYRDNTLLIADVSDEARQQDFAGQLKDVAKASGLLTTDHRATQIFLDDYVATNSSTPVLDAKSDILSLFTAGSQGVGTTIFNGHSSTSRWTFRNLLNVADVASMANQNAPTFVLPLACYTTLYELPSVNTLAHQLLFQSEAGAVAISGAAYLSEYRENAEFAKRVLQEIKATNSDIGTAILNVKKDLMPWNDMVTNWTLLGDPSLRF